MVSKPGKAHVSVRDPRPLHTPPTRMNCPVPLTVRGRIETQTKYDQTLKFTCYGDEVEIPSGSSYRTCDGPVVV